MLKISIREALRSSVVAAMLVTLSIGQTPDKEKVMAAAERVFAKAAATAVGPAPGCALGVSIDGQSVFEKAFGMAEMEHSIANTPQTIFESGSVAKQFTAAAVVLLSLEGKLGLDEQVRKYIPELPDYGVPMTVRHLLNHTAGLRDWGTVMALTGVGRGSRVVTQDLAFDIVTRQKALDFTPGAEYSYSNSGYTLLSTIVERISKQKLPAFTEERFFKPLGMKNSSWRDDYQRLVPGRAQAYSRQGSAWRLEMPFMNVYGNGGMLTTVGDWLKWNAMLDSRSMGAPLVEALETVGVLNDGRKISYALGLDVSKYKGLREVSHSGATAGYQTYLARYPDQKLSIAVLCNGPSPNSGSLVRGIADEIAGPGAPVTQPEALEMAAADLPKYVTRWRDEKTHGPILVQLDNGVLRMNGAPLRRLKDGTFQVGTSPARVTFKLDKDGKPVSTERLVDGGTSRAFAEAEWKPTATELAAFAGDWFTDEAGATFTFAVEGEKAILLQRPGIRLPLSPIYKDHFSAPGGQVVWLSRDSSGKPNRLHVGASRMRDMFFERMKK
ncbi:MAG: serine hydrolase domain-containing protein [Pyrinomonadaceae bacterium]